MKLMICSDLHGSAYYTARLIEAFTAEGADRLAVLGDLYYHGPRNSLPEGYAPLEVAALLGGVKDKLTALRGNCDGEVDEAVSDFPLVEHAAFHFGKLNLLALHGQRLCRENPPAGYNCIASGHVHRAFIESEKGVLFIGPGSPSLPKDGRRAYLIVENCGVILKSLDGNVLDEVKL